MSWPLPTRSTSTSGSTASTSHSPPCPACGTAPSPSAEPRRRSAGPAGGHGGDLAPAGLTDAIRKVHDFLTVGAPAPLQEGVAAALDGLDEGFYGGLAAAYRNRRDLLYQALIESGFECTPPEGAYYI